MADVFISYANEDRERVKRVVKGIEGAGYSVWWDRRIGLGSSFDREIERELDSAGCVVVVWSKYSVDSDWVRNEAQEGLDRGVLIPLVVDGVKPPLAFRRAQTAILSEEPTSEELQGVLTAVESMARLNANHRLAGRSHAPLAKRSKPDKLAIAVLPFDNLSSDVEQEYFSDGVAEDILNGLAHSPNVTVRARNSSFAFKDQLVDTRKVAEQLNVSYIVNGSVRTVGNRVRVNARLTAVEEDIEVWSDRYDAELEDVFAVQDRVTEAILKSLDLQFVDIERQPVSPDAYHCLLRARYHSNRFETLESISALEEALQIEPSYVDALSQLGDAYGILASVATFSNIRSRDEFRDKVLMYQKKALAADPNAPVSPPIDAPLQERINKLDHLTRRYPHKVSLAFAYASLFRQIGRSDLEIRILDQQVSQDPLSGVAYRLRGDAKLFAGMLEEATEDFDSSERFGHVPLHIYRSLMAFFQRDVASLEQLVAQDWTLGEHFRQLMSAAIHYLRKDNLGVDQLLAPLEAQRDEVSHHVLYWVALLKGENEAALTQYREALLENDFASLQNIRGYPGLRALFPEYYAQPGYEAMLRKFKLDLASVEKLVIPELTF